MKFLLPSKPLQIAFVLDETVVTKDKELLTISFLSDILSLDIVSMYGFPTNFCLWPVIVDSMSFVFNNSKFFPIVEKIVTLLFDERKKFMRVCFIGTDRKIQQMFRNALKGKANFAFSFINDLEQAKE